MENKKKIIIISAVAVAVVATIIGVTVLLVSLYAANDKEPATSTDVVVSDDYAEQDGDAQLSVGSAEGKKGDIVKIPVKISNNPGFMASLMNFKYDTSTLKYIGYEKGDFLKDYEFVDKNGVLKFLGCEDSDINKNGLLFNLKFEILKDSAKAEIKLEIEDMINYDEKSIKTAVENGNITVK